MKALKVLRDALSLIVGSSIAATLAVLIVTFGRIDGAAWMAVGHAVLANIFIFLPPLIVRNCDLRVAFAPLLGVAWRLPASCLVIASVFIWQSSERNYVAAAILTCYFVTLPLESWKTSRQI